jgi:hypothetical protein
MVLRVEIAGVARVSVISAHRRGGMVFFGSGQAGAIKRTTTPMGLGVMTQTRSRPARGVGQSCCGVEAADVAVAEPVVHEGDDLAGYGGLGDRSVVTSLRELFALIVKP